MSAEATNQEQVQQTPAAESYAADVAKFEQQQAARGTPESEAQLEAFLSDPKSYTENIIQRAVQQSTSQNRHELEVHTAIQEARQKYPEFNSPEKEVYVTAAIQAVQQKAAAEGKPLSFSQAIDEGVKKVRTDFGLTVNPQHIRNAAMNFGSGSQFQEPAGALGAEDVQKMSFEEHNALKAKLLRG
jgi:hypothetical protein